MFRRGSSRLIGGRLAGRLARLFSDSHTGPNVQKCGRVRHSSTVELRMADGRASYGGLVTCGAVWLCPPCQAKIAAYRALEVAAVTEWAESNGVAMFFGALTVHHGPNDPLSMSLGTLSSAWRRLIQGAGGPQSGRARGSGRAVPVGADGRR